MSLTIFVGLHQKCSALQCFELKNTFFQAPQKWALCASVQKTTCLRNFFLVCIVGPCGGTKSPKRPVYICKLCGLQIKCPHFFVLAGTFVFWLWNIKFPQKYLKISPSVCMLGQYIYPDYLQGVSYHTSAASKHFVIFAVNVPASTKLLAQSLSGYLKVEMQTYIQELHFSVFATTTLFSRKNNFC